MKEDGRKRKQRTGGWEREEGEVSGRERKAERKENAKEDERERKKNYRAEGWRR